MPIMSRKATPQAPEVNVAIERIRSHCERTNTSINRLSKLAGVSQSALARFMMGERKSMTDVAKKVLSKIDSRHNEHSWHNAKPQVANIVGTDGYQIIESAIGALWDGNPTTADFIAAFLQALKPALALATSAIGAQRDGGET